jgi:beta-aspartyl-peptidase (threonine type)
MINIAAITAIFSLTKMIRSRYLGLGFIVLTTATVNAAAGESAAIGERAAEIEAILKQQADAWNRGDIDAFMEHYWKSDSLTFSSGGQTTRGWQATKDNYRRRYPTREQMGKLDFSQLEISPIGSDGVLVLGNWRLDRATSPVGGNFSLVLRRMDGRWLIVHDHTSRAEPPAAAQPDVTGANSGARRGFKFNRRVINHCGLR